MKDQRIANPQDKDGDEVVYLAHDFGMISTMLCKVGLM
jgi:hypothetical protein